MNPYIDLITGLSALRASLSDPSAAMTIEALARLVRRPRHRSNAPSCDGRSPRYARHSPLPGAAVDALSLSDCRIILLPPSKSPGVPASNNLLQPLPEQT